MGGTEIVVGFAAFENVCGAAPTPDPNLSDVGAAPERVSMWHRFNQGWKRRQTLDRQRHPQRWLRAAANRAFVPQIARQRC